jgi:hypothetical protein
MQNHSVSISKLHGQPAVWRGEGQGCARSQGVAQASGDLAGGFAYPQGCCGEGCLGVGLVEAPACYQATEAKSLFVQRLVAIANGAIVDCGAGIGQCAGTVCALVGV